MTTMRLGTHTEAAAGKPGRRPGLRPGRRFALTAAAGAMALIVMASTMLVGGLPAARAVAAPNPLRSSTAMHLLNIAADGSYQVTTTETLDLALDFSWDFGGDLHDGFRLPDTQSLLPPYLRAEYAQAHGTIDGTTAEASIETTHHSVDIGFTTDRLDPGGHTGVLDYRVSGAAVAAEALATSRDDEPGVVVYFRPLDRDELVIVSAETITGVECEGLAPEGTPCGKGSGKVWTVSSEELTRTNSATIDAVRIMVDADPDDLRQPVID